MLTLIPSSDPILRARATEVTDILGQVTPHLTAMRELMLAKDGAGLAAPQVGIPLRFFISIIPGAELMINPRVIKTEAPFGVVEEGCLTWPGQITPVRRSERILVEWTSQFGTQRAAALTNLAARIAQHEIDHLNGICLFP